MRYLAFYGLKFPIFRPDCPAEALHTTAAADIFIHRVVRGMTDGVSRVRNRCRRHAACSMPAGFVPARFRRQ